MLAYSFVDQSLTIALLTLSFTIALSLLRRNRTAKATDAPRWPWIQIVLWGGFVAVVVAAASTHTDPVSEAAPLAKWPAEKPANGYVGSDACISCHPNQHSSWRDSWHRTMTQVATPENVVAPFDGRELGSAAASVKVIRKDDRFQFKMRLQPFAANQGPERINEELPVVMTTGMHHEQMYWLQRDPESPLLEAAPFAYLVETEQWVPRESTFISPPVEHRVMLDVSGRWHSTCIKCHATRGELNSATNDVENQNIGDFDPQTVELGISCEACHGPGAQHIAANQNPLTRYAKRITGGKDPTIVNPANLDHVRSSSICGSCHSIRLFEDFEKYVQWAKDGFEFRPGDDLFDSDMEHLVQCYTPALKDTTLEKMRNPELGLEKWFWSDGMVRVSGREFTGMIGNPCFHDGEMSCLSCHQLHQQMEDTRPTKEWANDQLAVGLDGDQACLQCHTEMSAPNAITAHTHHPVKSSGSRCMNCHMPHTVLGLMKAMRSHMIDIPRAQTTIDTGRPNACNQCHLKEPLGWAASHLESWYDQPMPDLSSDDEAISLMGRMALAGDAGQRALAAWSLGWDSAQSVSGADWIAPYLAHLLNDPYDTVRFMAERSLRTIPEFEDLDYDFTAEPEIRRQVSEDVLRSWNEHGSSMAQTNNDATGPNSVKHAASVLIDADGDLDQSSFDEWASRRDDRPVILAE
ncbi:MAG: multiheme c-type cytochrome [Planctomycetota bacterium]